MNEFDRISKNFSASEGKDLKLKALNGFNDILPGETELWRQVEERARDIFARFNFAEIRLPILEKTELFARSIGETTDIVEKEMYTFVDKQITMRPEATASLLRAYIEHGLYVQKPVQRLFTIGPMFRHERPQQGRLRQFHQMDVEVLGSANPRVDAELMAMGTMLLSELGLSVTLELNSLGCPDCRPAFRESLLAFLESRQEALCDDCKRRRVTNPLRVLDCKNPSCRSIAKDAPSIQEHLCPECGAHFLEVQDGLRQLGIAYRLNTFMVRGLDYYCRTTFEFTTTDLGSQSAVCAGGRYDGLVEQLGGPQTPGIGCAMGMERLVLLLLQKERKNEHPFEIDLFIAGLGNAASRMAFSMMQNLRKEGARVAMDLDNRGLKSQMKQADKAGARYALIVGDNELAKNTGMLRNMATQEQEEIPLENIRMLMEKTTSGR
jgi:histidyl-tRNA synthetase